MSPKRASAINGLDYREVTPGTWVAVNDDGTVVASVKNKNPSKALALLVEKVLQVNRQIVLERDGWRCVKCGSFRNLSVHHKVHRGIGGGSRCDEPFNLESICVVCHGREHGQNIVGWRAA